MHGPRAHGARRRARAGLGGWSDSTNPSQSAAPLEVYDPAADRSDLLPVTLAHPRHDHVAVLAGDCTVVIAGGQTVVGTGRPDAPREVEVLVVPAQRAR